MTAEAVGGLSGWLSRDGMKLYSETVQQPPFSPPMWLVLLLVLVIAMALSFGKTDRVAAIAQIPYILWLLFAAYLNYGVWQLNG